MLLEFDVPVGREHYGTRNTEAPWKRLAEHDMKQWIKDSEGVLDIYRFTADMRSHISFEWLEEFEKEDPHRRKTMPRL